MNYRIHTPYEKLRPECYGDQPRVYAERADADARCAALNAAAQPEMNGTFAVHETNEPVGE